MRGVMDTQEPCREGLQDGRLAAALESAAGRPEAANPVSPPESSSPASGGLLTTHIDGSSLPGSSSEEQRFLTASGNPLDPAMLFIDLTEADEDLAAQEAYLAALTQDVKPDPDSAQAAKPLLDEHRNRAVSPWFCKQTVVSQLTRRRKTNNYTPAGSLGLDGH